MSKNQAKVFFDNKYRAQLQKVKNRESELSELLKVGGGKYLETLDARTEIQALTFDAAVKAPDRGYSDNLDAKIGILDRKIELIKGKKAADDKAIEKAVEAQAEKSKAVVAKAEELAVAVKSYVKAMKGEYDKASSVQDAKDRIAQYRDGILKQEKELVESAEHSGDPLVISAAKDQSERNTKAVNAAYDSMAKAIDAASETKAKVESDILAACKEAAKAELPDTDRIANMALLRAQDKIAKTLAELPQKVIDEFNRINKVLYKLVTGFELNLPPPPGLDAAVPTVNELIAKIQAYLNPVFSTMTSLPVPSIPVLSPIIDIMQMVAKVEGADPNVTDEAKKKIEQLKSKMKVPPAWKDSLNSMKDTVMIVMMCLPTLLIQLVFSMIDKIIGMFNEIAGVIGVPGIPYPLSLVPQCVELMPKLYELMKILPQALYQMVEEKMKELGAKMLVLGEGSVDAIASIPQALTGEPGIQCPEALKNKIKEKMEQEQTEKELKRAEKDATEIQKMNELSASRQSSASVSGLFSAAGTWMAATASDITSSYDMSSFEASANAKLMQELADMVRSPNLPDMNSTLQGTQEAATTIDKALGITDGTTMVA